MPVIELTEVHKRYGEVVALDGVDLTVEQGELVALLGPNGAGKSTAFELLLGLGRPTSGRLEVFGGTPGRREVVGRLGAMLQNAGLPESVTVAELVQVIGRSYPRAWPVDAVLERVGLAERAGRTITDLSGGERQRLLLAAALVGAPELLLLDEPTAAMDVDARRGFWAEARSAVSDGTTLLFATHDLAEADAVAHRVVVLHRGRVVADATPGELKRRVHGKLARMVTDLPVAAFADLPGGGPADLDDTGAGVDPARHRVRVLTPEPAQLIAALVERGQHIEDLTIADAGLEDAFIALTSEELTSQPVPEGAHR
jgi:ABC-2 type transport system ATP-binding protein